MRPLKALSIAACQAMHAAERYRGYLLAGQLILHGSQTSTLHNVQSVVGCFGNGGPLYGNE